MTITATRTLDEAIDQGFIAMRKGRKLNGLFFHHCWDRDIPYVFIEIKATHAEVGVDLYGSNLRMTDHGRKAVADLLRDHGDGYITGANSPTRMDAPRVALEDAPGLAQELAELLRQPPTTTTKEQSA